MLNPKNFEKRIAGKQNLLYSLINSCGITVELMNYGATILSIIVPDKNGHMDDIVLGFDHLDKYCASRSFFGAIVGRYANRVNRGRFNIDDILYQLEANDTEGNHLHGGSNGYDTKMWSSDKGVVTKQTEQSITFEYVSKDGESNYPGELTIKVKYTLTNDNELIIEYHATTDKATIINLTNHSFFNLKGEGNGDILNHELMINATLFTPVDQRKIPTGKLESIKGTAMDFSFPKRIGKDIYNEEDQLHITDGYDHNWCFDNNHCIKRIAAKVSEPITRRFIEVSTNQPGIQFYTSNHFDGSSIGKTDLAYKKHEAFCLETQGFPDAPNQSSFPATLLYPGEEYNHRTIYKFGVTI